MSKKHILPYYKKVELKTYRILSDKGNLYALSIFGVSHIHSFIHIIAFPMIECDLLLC